MALLMCILCICHLLPICLKLEFQLLPKVWLHVLSLLQALQAFHFRLITTVLPSRWQISISARLSLADMPFECKRKEENGLENVTLSFSESTA